MHATKRCDQRAHLFAITVLGLSLFSLLDGGPEKIAAAEPLPPAAPQTQPAAAPAQPAKLTAEGLRKEFPLESIVPRLDYERKRVEADKDRPDRKLSEESAKRLEKQDQMFDTKLSSVRPHLFLRAESLRMLHSDEVDKFIASAGFGISRMPRPSPRELKIPEMPPVPFARVNPSAETSRESPVKLPATEEIASKQGNPLRLPPMDRVHERYDSATYQFVMPYTLGYFKSRDQVAGFTSHQFNYTVEMDYPFAKDGKPLAETSKWVINRLELVSLLKHDKPAVYLSEHLPRMDELKAAKTRPLNGFEEKSLTALRDGEDLLVDATPNHLTMLGAIRASKGCVDCHYVKHGELLGAFSYTIDRETPIKVAPVAEKPVN